MAQSTLGSVIREIRERRGWEQYRLAQAVGVAPSTLCRWERDEFLPRAHQLHRIDHALRAGGEIVRAHPVAQEAERGRVLDATIRLQQRAMRRGEPARVRGELLVYPDGRREFRPDPDGPDGGPMALPVAS